MTHGEYIKQWRLTVRGRVNAILASQRHGSVVRGHPKPTYSVQELEDWLIGQGFIPLHNAWEASGFEKDLMPSTDRLDNSVGYIFENLRLVTWKENRDKSYRERKANELITSQNTRVNQLTKSGAFIKTFDSIESAAREVNGDSANILKVCQRKPYHHSVKGFRWEFTQ